MMSLKLLVFLNIALIYSHCKNDDSGNYEIDKLHYEAEINNLKNQMKFDSEYVANLNREIGEINLLLDSVNSINGGSLTNVDSISILDKISKMQTFLANSDFKIKNLENEVFFLKNLNQVALLNNIIKSLKKDLVEKQIIIEKLKLENDSLKLETIDLGDSINRINNLKNDIVSQYEAYQRLAGIERGNFIIEKKKLQSELEITKQMIIEERALAYLDLAKELLKQYEDSGPGFLNLKKEMRNKFLLQAYNNFRSSCLLGNSEANQFIIKLLTNKDYSKNLEIDRSGNFNISNCGI